MAIGAFVEVSAADAAGAGYNGRITSFVILSCIVAGSGGILFGYDLGISGTLHQYTTTTTSASHPNYILLLLSLNYSWIYYHDGHASSIISN
jgi:hypothetical protein